MVTLTLAIVGEGAYVYWKKPIFVSRASMWETVKMTLPGGGIFSEDMQSFLGTMGELLQSRTLHDQALTRMRTMTNSMDIPVDDHGQPLPVSIRVGGGAKSQVFGIEANSANPAFTQNYLNALMQTYLDYKKNVRKVVSGDTLASISEQVQRWERDLKTEQDALSAYERTNNLTVIQEESAVLGGYLAKLRTQLSDLQMEDRLLNAAETPVNPGSEGTTNSAIPLTGNSARNGSASASPASSDQLSAVKELELLKMQRERLSKSLRPKHPKIVKLDEQIDRIQRLQEIYNRQSQDQLLASRQVNQRKIENIQASIKEWEVKVLEANKRIAEAARLKLNVRRVESVYDRLVALVQNVGISRNIDQESLAILEPASPPKRSYTSEKYGLIIALFGGLAAGLGIVFLIGLWDDRFTSLTEVNAAVGDVVVGMLPNVEKDKADIQMPLLDFNDPRHIYAESYRSLRSALLFQPNESERPKVLLITSAMPSEGKSTITANLARTFAQSGSRVLLVDGDLRCGHLHHSFGLKSEPGLAELLQTPTDPDTVIQTDSTLPNLKFIARGSMPRNSGDLLLGTRVDELLSRWRREFDYVLIDSSPVFAADDACCLAPKVDGTLFVVRSHHSGARAVREAMGVLTQRQARIVGVIFNGADASSRSYYYYKYSDYHPRPGMNA